MYRQCNSYGTKENRARLWKNEDVTDSTAARQLSNSTRNMSRRRMKTQRILQLVKICLISVCFTTVYLGLYALSITNGDTSSLLLNSFCERISRNKFNCSFVEAMSMDRYKTLCVCDQGGKPNSNNVESVPDSEDSVSITLNPRDLTPRHINYYPPDEASKNGLGSLKLPDSLPWKALERRLIYVRRVLHRSSRVVNDTHLLNDLRLATQTLEDINTKLELAHRLTDSNFEENDDETNIGVRKGQIFNRRSQHKNKANLTSMPKPKEICPETYKGQGLGYPFFNIGWERENCSYQKPLRELVTVIFDFSKHTNLTAVKMIDLPMASVIQEVYPGLEIIVATQKSSEMSTRTMFDFKKINTSFVSFSSINKTGKILNNLTTLVTTPYTYIATDVFSIDEDSRFERLVREIVELNIPVIGSSVKDEDGLWSMNCYQTTHRNFTLKYQAGYYHSWHECVFCNFTQGPFMARTHFLKEHKFDEHLEGPLVFRDYFLKLNRFRQRMAVCPDSMIYVNTRSVSRAKWLPFAQKWQVNKLVLESDERFEFDCEESRIDCYLTPGLAVPPCCLKQLAENINFVLQTCREHKIICELQEGTLLGAVKFGKVLPWERDADITFLSSNFTAFVGLETYLRSNGFSMKITNEATCCKDGVTFGGVFLLSKGIWHLEHYGQHIMDSGLRIKRNRTQTKMVFHGELVEVPRNPGLFVRNRYGPEVYKHAQHWSALGQRSGWEEYPAGHFTRCTKPGNHDCLDQYSADGNLQFQDP